MKLDIQPLIALCDQKINIRVSDLPAYGKVKISASMSLPWAKSVLYESAAWFTADADGRVDLSRQKPDSGAYDFINSMGLIVSMKRVMGKAKEITQNISVSDHLFIDIQAEHEQEKESARLERLFISPEVKRLKISDEFVGELFYTENIKNKTIVVLGGSSNENIDTLIPYAALLASHGFNILALAYFGEKGVNASLAEIRLEYFEKVFAWLAKKPETASKEIYVWGGSIGGELALLLASRYPIITKVVAVNPHAYCFQGLTFKNVSSWSYGRKSLPFIKFAWRSLFANVIRCFIKNKPFGLTYTYKKSVELAKNREDARIKIENAKADILLFGGQKDDMWNTHDACVKVMEELATHNYPYAYQYVTYENAGHASYAPNIIPVIDDV